MLITLKAERVKSKFVLTDKFLLLNTDLHTFSYSTLIPLSKGEFKLIYLHLIPQVKDKISEDDRKMIVDKCNEAVNWLDSGPDASKDEYERRQKELESICNPVITKLYQSSGGAPPPEAGGFSQGGAPPPSDSSGGPTIEEVD